MVGTTGRSDWTERAIKAAKKVTDARARHAGNWSARLKEAVMATVASPFCVAGHLDVALLRHRRGTPEREAALLIALAAGSAARSGLEGTSDPEASAFARQTADEVAVCRLALADHYQATGRHEDAADVLDVLDDMVPPDRRAEIADRLVDALYDAGEFASCRSVIRSNRLAHRAWTFVGASLMSRDLGDGDTMEWLDAALERDWKVAEMLVALADRTATVASVREAAVAAGADRDFRDSAAVVLSMGRAASDAACLDAFVKAYETSAARRTRTR